MPFDPNAYGREIRDILELDGGGERLIPLVAERCSSDAARQQLLKQKPRTLFPTAAAPEAALAGLWLYFSCFEESHSIAQDIASVEGSFWHAIVHRQEPDSGNSAYWFRRAGTHCIFPPLFDAAREVVERYPEAEFRLGPEWDPFAFITFCERARQQPNSLSERAALEIQRAEWQLLFDYCARPRL